MSRAEVEYNRIKAITPSERLSAVMHLEKDLSFSHLDRIQFNRIKWSDRVGMVPAIQEF